MCGVSPNIPNMPRLQYSSANLSDTNEHRRLIASEVRAQAVAIPIRVERRPHFPHAFGNREELNFANPQPLIEHPVTPSGPWAPGTPPGPARIVVNQTDRSFPEVMYHDPTKPIPPGARFHPFTKSEFRGKDRSKATGLEDSLERMGL